MEEKEKEFDLSDRWTSAFLSNIEIDAEMFWRELKADLKRRNYEIYRSNGRRV